MSSLNEHSRLVLQFDYEVHSEVLVIEYSSGPSVMILNFEGTLRERSLCP